MATLIALYKTPQDPAAFDRHYRETHLPIAKTLPGLRSYRISRGAVAAPAGPSGLHLVATLTFDSLEAIQAAFVSPQGQAAVEDVGKFATGGVDLYMFEDEAV